MHMTFENLLRIHLMECHSVLYWRDEDYHSVIANVNSPLVEEV